MLTVAVYVKKKNAKSDVRKYRLEKWGKMRNFHLCKADKSSEIIQGSKSKRPSCRIDFNLFNICTRDSFVRV